LSQAELNGIAEGVYAFIGAEGDSNAGAIETVDRVRLPAYESLPWYKEWMPWNVRNVFRALRTN
jgi:hypothetical protein